MEIMVLRRFFVIVFLAFSLNSAFCITNVTHVIHILVDGLSGIYLKKGIDENPSGFPNFGRFVREGACTFNARTDYDYTETLPDTVTTLTARPVIGTPDMPPSAKHLINFNYWNPYVTIHSYGDTNKGYISSVFDVVHDSGMTTGFFSEKDKFQMIVVSYNEVNGGMDLVGEDNGRNKIDFSSIIDTWNNPAVVLSFAEEIQSNHFNYSFVHIADMDYAGHYYGWGTEIWYEQLVVVDQCLGLIFDVIDNDEEFAGKTAIILTADHGGGYPPTTHVYPEYELNYTIPLLVWGAGFTPGSDLYDYFSNRLDPQHSRPDYGYRYQPLRNGDSSNIALSLLGLNPIPGSYMIPIFGQPPAVIKYEIINGFVVLSWKTNSGEYVLEASSSLSANSNWTVVNGNFITDGALYHHSHPIANNAPLLFFRLRKTSDNLMPLNVSQHP